MNVPLLSGWFERRGRRRVRGIMRGYRALKARGDLDRLVRMRDTLANTHLRLSSDRASSWIFGAGRPHAERIVRQYLLVRVGHLTLNRALLLAACHPDGALVHPLPAEWRRALTERGVRVAMRRSALAWQAYLILLWGYGVLTIARTAWQGVACALGGPVQPGRYAFFENLSAENLPAEPGRLSHDIVTWYSQWPGRQADLDSLCHRVQGVPAGTVNGLRVVPVPSAVPPPTTPPMLVRYLAWGAFAGLAAALDLLRGRWWHAALLTEAAPAALARGHAPAALAREYLFHNSGWIYRPLWTYDAERRGSKISFYFYSTNCESFKQAEGYPVQANCWQAMDWPLYLVWDERQAEFVREAVGERANTRVAGPIWFQGREEDVAVLPPRSVAVFDVQPKRASRYPLLGEPVEYYTPHTANAFLDDIHSVARSHGCVMIHKRKRDIGERLHPRYAALLGRLSSSDAFMAVAPDASALDIIARSDVVVSMPFTSTALLGRHLGKPSIFYDPHGFVQKDDRAAHGIPVVTGQAELSRWLAAHLPAAVASDGVRRSHG